MNIFQSLVVQLLLHILNEVRDGGLSYNLRNGVLYQGDKMV